MPRAREAKELQCTWRLERLAYRRGWLRVAGCDEAGRGALLGPVYAAAVILDPSQPIAGLNDSKKLSPERRSEFDVEIRLKAISFCVVAVSSKQVDALNVYEASRQAMILALTGLSPSADYILTDAMPLRGAAQLAPHWPLIHGDARSVSIAAASILAKVARDAHLVELDLRYPQYHLGQNKGYGTAEHIESLRRCGPCCEHRRTFQPVRDCLSPLFPLV
ncbi:MAG: ribonuclease HII [Candidatus Acidiferrales bacterium]